MKYISVCSGVEAATVAWHPLGWSPLWFSEIEPFPSAVLAHHYPDTPNLGDMTKFKEWPDANVDVLVGGTPCQSYSVAGLRKGLDDTRGNLMLVYGAIAAKYRPKWLVWENVPGVLSSDGGRDFGSLLGLLSGRHIEVPPTGWQNSGIVPGRKSAYGLAWRVLDAQYFGVAQRRRRVFVVGHLGDWRAAAAVLFERHSLSGHPAPSREKRQTAPTIPSRSSAGGGLGTDFDCDGGLIPEVSPTLLAQGNRTGGDRPPGTTVDNCESLIPTAYGQNRQFGPVEVSHAINAHAGPHGRLDFESETFLVQPQTPVAFSCKDYAADAGDISPTLRSMNHNKSHANAGGQVAVAFAQNQRDEIREMEIAGVLAAEPGMKQQTYVAQPHTLAIRGRADGHQLESRQDGTANAILTPNGGRGGIGVGAIAHQMQVRRLTPIECERLQGFQDNYTRIPWRNKPAEQCPDGPRYKSLGNSMAVPVMRWIGERINTVSETSRRSA